MYVYVVCVSMSVTLYSERSSRMRGTHMQSCASNLFRWLQRFYEIMLCEPQDDRRWDLAGPTKDVLRLSHLLEVCN